MLCTQLASLIYHGMKASEKYKWTQFPQYQTESSNRVAIHCLTTTKGDGFGSILSSVIVDLPSFKPINMKFLPTVAVAIAYLQGVLSVPASIEDLVTECGALGVMKVDKESLPPGVNPDNVRKCLNHPEGLLRQPQENEVFKRDCWKRASLGCSNSGYCWRQCGQNGEWCWAAEEGGLGSWIRCSKWQDCNVNMACGGGGCDVCGCSC